MLFRNIEGRILPYSSQVNLIGQNLTQDKRVVTDFRHLNVRIAKNNLVYPLVRETFLSFREFEVCSSFSVRIKRHIPIIMTFKRFKKILQYITIFHECFIHISENTYGIKYFTLNLAILYKCNLRLLTK